MQYNYRSTDQIVHILNNIYNDEEFSQSVPEEHKEWKGICDPEVICCDDIEKVIRKKRRALPDLLVLYLLNKDRFHEIGAGDLYSAYGRMQKYAHGMKYSAQEVLQIKGQENPDAFLQMMFLIDEILMLYRKKIYGSLINDVRFYKKLYNGITLELGCHEDKEKLRAIFDKLLSEYEKNITIGEFFSYLKDQAIIQDEYIEALEADEDNKNIQDVPLKQFRHLADYLRNPHVSTQHGVKGESHESVLFVAGESSGNPNVRMYDFFRLWSCIEISLPRFEAFYYSYQADIKGISCKVDTSKITSEQYKGKYGKELEAAADKIVAKYAGSPFFQHLCAKQYTKFQQAKNATAAKNCFTRNLNLVYGTLQAYRIFYVGCSRARRNFTILVDNRKIEECKKELVARFEKVGFKVYDSDEYI